MNNNITIELLRSYATTLVFDLTESGAIVYVNRHFMLVPYQHYGIYFNVIGIGPFVIHYAPKNNSCKPTDAEIHISSWDNFSNGDTVYTVRFPPELHIFSPEIILNKALSRLGEKNYNLFSNNCEHYAYSSYFGFPISYQVQDFANISSKPLAVTVSALAAMLVGRNPLEVTIESLPQFGNKKSDISGMAEAISILIKG